MSADEAPHWDTLHDGWMVDRVNHSEIYSDHGKHTNMVESFFWGRPDSRTGPRLCL